LTISNCASCHAKPPTGSSFPNIAGTHAIHDSFQGVTGACNACHSASGTTTQLHYDHANARPGHDALRVAPGEVQTLSTYNAKTGAASFNPSGLTCSNVSCHGGQATPNWQTGAIVVNDQCTNCHISGTTQFNSYNSGEHTFHVNLFGVTATTCKRCHNTTTLAVNHLTTLGTTAMEGPASATIGGGSTTVTSYVGGSCTPSVGSSGGCHSTRSW